MGWIKKLIDSPLFDTEEESEKRNEEKCYRAFVKKTMEENPKITYDEVDELYKIEKQKYAELVRRAERIGRPIQAVVKFGIGAVAKGTSKVIDHSDVLKQ